MQSGLIWLKRGFQGLVILIMCYLIAMMHWLCYSCFQCAYDISQAHAQVATWQTVDGELLQAEVASTPSSEFRVRYRYELDGKQYENDVLALADVGSSVSSDRKLMEAYWDQQKNNGHVTVYVDNQDPSNSVIYASSELVSLHIVVGIFCTVMTLLLSGGFLVAAIQGVRSWIAGRPELQSS